MKHFVIITKLWGGGAGDLNFLFFLQHLKNKIFIIIQKAKSPAAAAETDPLLALPATAAAAAAARMPGRTGGG
jgi:hypothetical protein